MTKLTFLQEGNQLRSNGYLALLSVRFEGDKLNISTSKQSIERLET